ncbi:MAG: hypothetical protein COS68_02040 [Elusimicrobia bacterium CG06_land_8_20_14_3_00_38_11]|nr:MAG: hypothetical protein COS68_02040 [Elusimicrobia bacterium CG06_land_8_20_14_3_00_38_11]
MEKYKEEIDALLSEIKDKIQSGFGYTDDESVKTGSDYRAFAVATVIKRAMSELFKKLDEKMTAWKEEIEKTKMLAAQKSEEADLRVKSVELPFKRKLEELDNEVKIRDSEIKSLRNKQNLLLADAHNKLLEADNHWREKYTLVEEEIRKLDRQREEEKTQLLLKQETREKELLKNFNEKRDLLVSEFERKEKDWADELNKKQQTLKNEITMLRENLENIIREKNELNLSITQKHSEWQNKLLKEENEKNGLKNQLNYKQAEIGDLKKEIEIERQKAEIKLEQVMREHHTFMEEKDKEKTGLLSKIRSLENALELLQKETEKTKTVLEKKISSFQTELQKKENEIDSYKRKQENTRGGIEEGQKALLLKIENLEKETETLKKEIAIKEAQWQIRYQEKIKENNILKTRLSWEQDEKNKNDFLH